jgi:predicted transposase/invertase (TIGR01784 family)
VLAGITEKSIRTRAMKEIVNPHDKFFKDVFSKKETTVDFLANYLPKDVLKLLELGTAEIRKDSFVDEEFKEFFSDLLYEVKLAGRIGYIYVLFEHKSFPDRFTPLQLLKYMIQIWELHRQQSTRRDLPVILPLIIYQGIGTWDADNRFSSLMETCHEALLPYIPDFRFILIDLSRYSDEQIKGGVVARVTLLAMKYALRDELPEKLFEMLKLLSDLADKKKGLDCLEMLFRYLVQATDKLSKADFQKALSAIPEKGDSMPTLAEQWIEEGRVEGKVTEAQDVILELLEEQFGSVPSSLSEKLRRIRSHEVLRLLRRQIRASSSLGEFESLVQKAL